LSYSYLPPFVCICLTWLEGDSLTLHNPVADILALLGGEGCGVGVERGGEVAAVEAVFNGMGAAGLDGLREHESAFNHRRPLQRLMVEETNCLQWKKVWCKIQL